MTEFLYLAVVYCGSYLTLFMFAPFSDFMAMWEMNMKMYAIVISINANCILFEKTM